VRTVIKRAAWAFVVLLLLVVVVGGVAWMRLHPSPPGLQVWSNGHVLTMDANGRQATALVIEGDHIVAVGSDEDVQRWWPDADVALDLEGRTVVPGFIEAHGHFPGAA
jgi:hypothetical protein